VDEEDDAGDNRKKESHFVVSVATFNGFCTVDSYT
jgi:hypothetical protein